MFTAFKRLAAIGLTAALLSPAAFAQDKAHDHDHDHSSHADEIVSTQPKGPVEFTFTPAPDDHIIGDANAPVTLIVYASVTCPHCADWFQNDWPEIKTDFIETGKVKAVMREFPTAPSQMAMAGFLIANCAPEDDYFSLIEHQMEKQDEIFERAKAGEGQEAYLEISKLAGLEDEAAMTECFASEEGIAKIMTSMERAESAGLDSVPGFFIDGEIQAGTGSIHDALTIKTSAKIDK